MVFNHLDGEETTTPATPASDAPAEEATPAQESAPASTESAPQA